MKTATKIHLIIATALVLIGIMIFFGAMTVLEWNFTKLQTDEYVTNNYYIDEEYQSISILSDTADIIFDYSDNSKHSVVCYENKNAKHSVSVKDGQLVIEITDERKWYEHIGISFSTPQITLYIPQGEYEELSIKSSTGDIDVPKEYSFKSIYISTSTGSVKNYASASKEIIIKSSTGDVDVKTINSDILDISVSTGRVIASQVNCKNDFKIKVSTGKASATDIVCKNFISSGNTGNMLLENVIATNKFSIKRSTGDINFDSCDADEIYIETDTGDITGSILTDKIFIAQSNTGSIDIPKTVTGGKCEITTDTGDINLKIK